MAARESNGGSWRRRPAPCRIRRLYPGRWVIYRRVADGYRVACSMSSGQRAIETVANWHREHAESVRALAGVPGRLI